MIPKKEFYFIRHGQTDYSGTDSKVDHGDVSLNTQGVAQALKIEPVIAKLQIKSICFSPLKRARETKDLICPQIFAPQYVMPALGECSSEIWSILMQDQLSEHDDVKRFFQRVNNGMNEALSLEGPALIIAHGGIHRALCFLLELSRQNSVVGHCIPLHFIPSDEGWSAREVC